MPCQVLCSRRRQAEARGDREVQASGVTSFPRGIHTSSRSLGGDRGTRGPSCSVCGSSHPRIGRLHGRRSRGELRRTRGTACLGQGRDADAVLQGSSNDIRNPAKKEGGGPGLHQGVQCVSITQLRRRGWCGGGVPQRQPRLGRVWRCWSAMGFRGAGGQEGCWGAEHQVPVAESSLS